MRRRVFLRTLSLAGGAAMLSACGISGIGVQARKAPAFADESLKDGQSPFLEAVSISFDPNTDKGRIVLNPKFKREGELRLVTEELTAGNPGFIYNHPWKLARTDQGVVIVKEGDQLLIPAIRVKEGESYRVRLGYQKSGELYNVSYTGMATYRLEISSGANLNGVAEGPTTLDPETIKPRDAEAAQPSYWRKESLR